MAPSNDRRLWPGTVPPAESSPARQPGSMRRTSTVDILWSEGLAGPLTLIGHGRDLATAADGTAITRATGHTEVQIDFLADRTIVAVSADPTPDGLAALVGARAGSGFRRTLAEACGDLVGSGSIVHLLLDEITPATLISGSSLARAGTLRVAVGGDKSRLPFGICSGWRLGGAMERAIDETGVPLLGWGPPAPDLGVADDPVAWHQVDPLVPGSLRRRRLIDVRPTGPGGLLEVEVRFRDSYWETDGTETVVHEYAAHLTVDHETWVVATAAVTSGPLPAPECPHAAASADRLVGLDVRGLREEVRDRFTGVSTCTHLNDVYRSLADLEAIWRADRRADAVSSAD